MEKQKTQNSQNNIEKEKCAELTLPDFETYYKTKGIKTVSCWHEDRYVD
jgi:hypothetical protein